MLIGCLADNPFGQGFQEFMDAASLLLYLVEVLAPVRLIVGVKTNNSQEGTTAGYIK
jgi:hypothetical protein